MQTSELICGLFRTYFKFKTPIRVYLFAVSAIESCLCYCELCKFLLHHKSNHGLTVAKSVCVCNKINTSIAAKQDFLKV